MRENLRLKLALAYFAWLLATPGVATAQQYLQDRSASEGPGFRVGRMELHPGVGVSAGYDSNIFLENDDPEDSVIMRVVAHLDVATLSPERRSDGESKGGGDAQKLNFRAGVSGSYYHYFSDRVDDNVGANAYFNLNWNPSPVFSLGVRDLFNRTVRPFTDPNTSSGTTASYGRNYNVAGITLVGKSRSQVLQGRLGYTNEYEFFDSAVFQYGDNLTHRGTAGLDWLFFPTSSLVWEFDYAYQDYVNPELAAASSTTLANNTRASTRIGFNGAITRTLSLGVFVGYTAGFWDEGDDDDIVTARADVRWQARPTITVSGGFDRQLRPSYIGNFTVSNRLFADAKFAVAGVSVIGVKSWVSFDSSGLALQPNGLPLGNATERDDIGVYAGVFGEYRLRAWLAFFGEAAWIADFTDFEYAPTVGPLIDPAGSYQKWEAWLGVRVFY